MKKIDRIFIGMIKAVEYIFNIPVQLGTLGLWDYEDAYQEASKYKYAEIRYRVATESYIVYAYPRRLPEES